MANLEIITIETVTKYGGRVAGKNYNLSKKYTGPALEVGKTYEAEIFTSVNGAKYINNAKETASQVVTKTSEVPVVTTASSSKVTFESTPIRTVVGRDFDKEARGKTLFGLYSALIQSPYLVNVSNDIEFIEKIRNFGTELFLDIFPEK